MESKTKQTRLVEAAGDELATLLSPVTPQSFVHEYWGKKALHVKGFRDKFKGFFDEAAFLRAVAEPGVPGASARHLVASFDKKTPPSRSATDAPTDGNRAFPISPEQVGPLLEAGATICLADISSRVPRLAYFAAAIKRQLGYPGPVAFNAYLSPPGVGFNWHFDGRIASTLQIEGSKRWRFSRRPALEWPRGNAVVMTDGSPRYDLNIVRAEWEKIAFDKTAITEVVLEPGDFLALPAGTWHDAAGGAGGSLALNLAFNPIAYTSIVGELLDAVLGSDPAWRGVKPLLPLLGGLPGEVEPRGLEGIARHLERAAEALRSVAADGAALAKVWSTFVQGDGPVVDPPGAVSGPIATGDRFRVRADGNVYVQAAEQGTRLSVGVGTRPRLDLSGDAMRFVQRALGARRFEAGECVGWGADAETKLPWGVVEEHLGALLREGVLERVSSAGK